MIAIGILICLALLIASLAWIIYDHYRFDAARWQAHSENVGNCLYPNEDRQDMLGDLKPKVVGLTAGEVRSMLGPPDYVSGSRQPDIHSDDGMSRKRGTWWSYITARSGYAYGCRTFDLKFIGRRVVQTGNGEIYPP